MGAHVLEQARLHGVGKLVDRRHGLRLPEAHAGPVQRGRPLERLPGGDERAVRRREEGAARRRARPTASSTALNAIFLLPANLYGPRDNFDLENSHVIPALIRKMIESPGRGRALGRRLADARVPLRRRLRRGARCSPPSATTAPSRSTSAPASRSRSASSPSSIAEVTGFDGRDRLGHLDAERPAAAELDASRAAELFGFGARTPLRDGLERTVAWYRAAAPAHAAR